MSFTAVITANVSDFEKGIQEAQKAVNGLEANVSNSLQDVGNSFVKVGKAASVFSAAVAATAVGIYAFTKSTADMANNLLSATIALDSSSDLLQQYKLIGIEAGTSTEAFAGAVEALTKRLKEAGTEGDNTSELMSMLGVSFNDAAGNMRRTGDITDDLIKSLASMDNVSQRNVIASQLFGRRWAEIAPILGLGADGIEKVKKEAYEMGVVLDTDALNAANNFSIATNKLTLQLQAMKDNLASELAPVLQATFGTLVENTIMPAIKSFAETVGALANKFNELPEGVKNTILAVTGVAVAMGPLLLAIGGVIKLLPTLIAGFAAVKVAIIAMTGPVGLLVAAIAAAVIAIIANWDEIKAYFVSGGGSEMFTAIKELAQSVWDRLVSIFNGIKDFVKTVWGAIGGTVKEIWKDAIGTVGSLLEFFMDYIKTAANFWRDIVNLDFKSALESLKANFNVIFSFIGRIVTNVLSAAAGALAGFLDIIGLDKWSSSVQKFADKMAVAFVKPEKAIEKTTTAVKKQVVAVKEAVKELDKIDGVGGGIGSKMSSAGLDFGTLSTPIKSLTITAPSFDLEAASKTLTDLGNFRAKVADNFVELGNLASSGLGSFADAIGNALGSGNFDDLGSELISALGSLAQQFGGMLISFGLASKQLQLLITNPVAAIAAGVALVALGAAAKASASKMVSNATSGGNYSTGGTSSYQSATTLGTSDYRGQYKDDYTVNFKIGTNELVGVLEMANNRKNRL